MTWKIRPAGWRRAARRNYAHYNLQLLYYIQQTVAKDWSVASDEGYDSPYNRARVDAWLKEQPELKPYRAILYHFPVMAYARESRRLIGLHTLTAAEIERTPRLPTLFENTLAVGDYAVDLHGSKKPELLELDLDHREDIPEGKFGERGQGPFAIPFECFIPETLDGFLAAEKNLSQSRLANGATRLQPSTMLMGQAVGAIAGLAVKYGVKPRELDPVLVQRVLLDGGDTLHITPLKDVAKAGWEWPAVQLVSVRGLMPLENGRFNPTSPLTPEAVALFMQRLFGTNPTLPGPVAGASLARLLEPAMAGMAVDVGKPSGESATHSVTRLQAAQLLAGFLEGRALARLAGARQRLDWPALRAPTPLTSEDMPPVPKNTLADSLRILVDRGVLTSPDYWLKHAVANSTCDGKEVQVMLRQAARILQPDSPREQALEVCAAAGVFNSLSYWKQNAVDGGRCSGEFVGTIINRLAAKLKRMPATSAPAKN